MMRREQEPQRLEKPREPSNELEELYSSWGIFDVLGTTIDLLPPDWLRVLNIARNLLDGKPIPGVNMSNALKALTERNVRIDYEKRLVTRRWQEPTETPSNDIKVRPIENLTELPRILPPHLLLADIDPDLFAYQAVSGNLPVSENQKPKATMEEKSETVEKLEKVRKVGSSMRQKVYVLLDVSLSMDGSYKLIFAKAVMMAYLAKAYEEKAQIYLRAFAGKTGNRQDCIAKNQFPALAQYILNISTYSGTDIATALAVAISDIKELDKLQEDELATTEIFLITDCGNHAPIPRMPSDVTLHTLHIQDGTEEALDNATYRYSRKAYADRVREIAKSSRTFTEIDPSNLELPLSDREAWLLKEEVGKLEEELSSRDLGDRQHDGKNDKGLQKHNENNASDHRLSPADREAWALREEAGKMEQDLSSKNLGNPQNDTDDLRNRIKKVREMATAYRKMHSTERSKKTEAKELEEGPIGKALRKTREIVTARKEMRSVRKWSKDASRMELKDTEKRARKMEFKFSPKGIKQAIKNALARRKFSLKRRKEIKGLRQPKLSGALFDFRIKQDK